MRGIVRAGLVILTSIQLVLGVWTQFFPEGFYRDFPTVSLTPPYSEHLMRDFGGATIGLAVAIGAAAIWLEKRLVVVALVAYLAFSIPHFLFHLEHLHGATSLEVLFLVATLGGSVLLPIAVLAITPRALRVTPAE